MSNPFAITTWQEAIQKTMAHDLSFRFNITGAAASSAITPGQNTLTTYAAISSQSTIDNYLGTTNEFLIAAFDATAMGADAFGGVINMRGQVLKGVQMVARCYSASNTIVTRQCQFSSALTASTLTTECAVGAYGNLGFKVDFGNTPDFDGLTAGTIEIILSVIFK